MTFGKLIAGFVFFQVCLVTFFSRKIGLMKNAVKNQKLKKEFKRLRTTFFNLFLSKLYPGINLDCLPDDFVIVLVFLML